MLKTALKSVIKRYWGLVAAIVMISGASQYRQEHTVSILVLSLALLLACLALLVVAVPLELHRARRHARALERAR